MASLQDKLKEEVASIGWAHLRPHFERGALVIVDDALSLVDVGVALAQDDATSVAGWMQTHLVRKPTRDGERPHSRQR